MPEDDFGPTPNPAGNRTATAADKRASAAPWSRPAGIVRLAPESQRGNVMGKWTKTAGLLFWPQRPFIAPRQLWLRWKKGQAEYA